MSIITSRPALRWGAPVAVLVAVVGGGAAARTLTASADPSLPPRTVGQLLSDLRNARLDGGSGTVVQRADLGLPAIPGTDGQGSSNLQALGSGSHTLRVWYAGPDHARVALLGTLGESDVVRSGRDVWVWDSQHNAASHAVLPTDESPASHPEAAPSPLAGTPQEAARAALAAIDPTTIVTAGSATRVAGRPVYELVLTPRDSGSLVGRVTLAVDAERHVPLRVRVYPAGSNSAAFETAFTQVSFARPDDAQFRFAPPPGIVVKEEGTRADPAATTPTMPRPTVAGKGWTSVLIGKLPAASDDRSAAGTPLDRLPRVSGAWGSGRLLTGRLFSVLFTDDGRVLAGAVRPERLYAAAG
ncbi:hypothetical protein HC031_23720 [Planosporangium thailandense]|uniref:MucB/RseB N-terminal domain-containing protein n=1 Tax=Planosporangium thailandense TaxID=765197 RepID=A0ABX0Y2Y3_9ACTN|nr:hypothetical protein [Planosporangium thailandense]NJC72703.1 hypothetical protein [Planosporangium thailandense]